jgi:hypothetical protein
MQTSEGALVLAKYGDRILVDEDEGKLRYAEMLSPSLTDPATLGCLLALVREAHGQFITTARAHGQWVVTAGTFGFFDTEAEALVAALEAA